MYVVNNDDQVETNSTNTEFLRLSSMDVGLFKNLLILYQPIFVF